MCPIIKNSKSYSTKDFINFIIMTLHEELNQKIESVNINFDSNFNYANSFNMFYQTYLKNFCSKISELFYAIQQTQTQCLNCGNTQYNFQAYFYLYFSLEEVKKYFINKLEEEILNNPIENKIKDKKEKFGNNAENNININRDNNATNMNNLITKICYPAFIFAKLVMNFNILDLIIFILINIGILVLSKL